jgi:hypothetical protein
VDLFSHLTNRWRDLFNVKFDVLLYDLTTTYFEINAADVAEGDKRLTRNGIERKSSFPADFRLMPRSGFGRPSQ